MGGRGGFNMGRGGGGRGFGGPRGGPGLRGRGGRGGRGGGITNMKKHVRKIFIGGLNKKTTDETLKEHFSQYGELTDTVVMKDPETLVSRGFGFVEMPNQSEGEAAVSQLNGQDLDGRALRVNEARPRPPRD